MKKKENEKLVYIFCEGESEVVFYKRVFEKYLSEVSKKVKNLKTGTGVDKQVASNLYHFMREKNNKNKELYVYVFIDKEGPATAVRQFDGEAVIKELKKYGINIKRIKSISSVEAIKMIESWFFHDIEGICKYIGMPITKGIKSQYLATYNLGHKDLSKLFKKGSKKRYYKKGNEDFLNQLNIDIIVSKCEELKNAIDLINKQFKK